MKIKLSQLKQIINEEANRTVRPVNENVVDRKMLRQLIKEEFEQLNEWADTGQYTDILTFDYHGGQAYTVRHDGQVIYDSPGQLQGDNSPLYHATGYDYTVEDWGELAR